MALNDAVLRVTPTDLSKLELVKSARITDVKHLASYSWIEAPSPTIAVPGSPPFWANTSQSRQVRKDSGLIYIAQNAARHPDSPMEPLFRSLRTLRPSFDLGEVDLISDRNNLRKLLSFVDPSSNRNGLEAFTITAESHQKTVIFSRQETKTTEYIAPHEFKGYGHEFEKAFTTSSSAASTGHHRIITYSFGNMRFVIRYETDACTASEGSKGSDSKTDEDELLKTFETLNLGQPPKFGGSKLLIRKEGQTTSIESTMEIKTRVQHRPIDFGEVATQLWISQTPNLVRAYHNKGRFNPPKVEDVSTQIQEWETSSQTTLKKFAALVAKIVGFVKEHKQAEIRYRPEEGALVISQRKTAPKMLPQDVYEQWTPVAETKASSASVGTAETKPSTASKGEKSKDNSS